MTFVGTYGTNGFHLPFTDTTSTTTLGYDTSGNGNNWTTNNISLTAGSTYDSMNDVPTLTSATASNYAVNNPSLGSTATLSNGNLTIVVGTSATKVLATIGMSSGKWYWEYSYTDLTGDGSCGIATAQTTIAAHVGSDAYSWGYIAGTGNKANNSTSTAYGASYTTGNVIGVAFDADAGTLTFYKNNTSQGTAFTGLTSGPYFPAFGDNAAGSSSTLWTNFGQQPFTYTPPTGYNALNTYNLPTPTIVRGNQYMDATLYNGIGVANTIMNAGSFQPDLVWIKDRSSNTSHRLQDTVRGVGNRLASDLTAAENADSSSITSFNSNGFSVGTNVNYNGSSDAYVGWQWKGGGTAVSNTNGSITSTVSANTTSGFSIVTYTNASSGTVGHGLGVAPAMVIYKDRTNATNWIVLHQSLTNMSTYYLTLNTSNAVTSGIALGGNPTSSVIYTNTNIIQNSAASVAYCFAQIAGFSAFGSYVGNGSTDGPFIYTGFRPKFILTKDITTSSYWWEMVDSTRSPYNFADKALYANVSDAEYSSSTYNKNLLSNGFKISNTNGGDNTSGSTYIYMAFAENPFRNALAR